MRVWSLIAAFVSTMTVTQAVPDSVPPCARPDPLEERGQIDVELEDHLDEIAVEPQAAQPPGVERRNADQMAQTGAVQRGRLVGDDHGAAGLGHPAHLAEGSLVVADSS